MSTPVDGLARPAPRRRWAAMLRSTTPEWLDEGRGTSADVADNLAEMWRVNRWLGGARALTAHLYPRLARARGATTVLDLGTGAAEGARTIAQWGRRRGLQVRVIGVDWAARHLAVARQQGAPQAGLSLLQADAVQLPVAQRGVDYVVATLLLHHFDPPAAVELLREGFDRARRGLIISDVVRGWSPLWAFHLVSPIFARHPFTRHDGALSIRRAYTPAEVRALAAAARLPNPRVYAHWPWRLTLVADRAADG